MNQARNKKEEHTHTERPPIVVVLEHVDHGKSTLLDYVRKTNTTADEAGGITQHISAYEVLHKNSEGVEKRITFLDTPGHKAFIEMRKRGATLADIAILVVSGEEGVKEQTLEVLKTIREGNMPYIVAITKIDRPNVDIQKTKQGLAEHEVLVEGYGGEVPVVPVSAKTGAGISELLDMILLLAALQDLKGTAQKTAEGIVVESHVSPKEGVSATIIITDGILKKGMYIATENAFSPVRKIQTFDGSPTMEATFSSPVIITGFNVPPAVGAPVRTFSIKKEAEEYARNKIQQARTPSLTESPTRVNALGTEDAQRARFSIPIIIKADTTGSLEALTHEIENLSKDMPQIKIVHTGVGTIEENDLKAALTSKHTIVIGFNVPIGKTAQQLAEQHGVTVQMFDIIYKLTEWLVGEIKRKTPKTLVEEQTGTAKIMKIFSRTKHKQVCGGKVLEGEIAVRQKIQIVRRGVEIDRGVIAELRQLKTKVGKVAAGSEFGALIETKYDIAAGDTLYALTLVEK